MADRVVCVEALLVGGAEVAARDATGRLATHLAATYGSASSLRCLLAHGKSLRVDERTPPAIDVDAEASGVTAIHLAAAGDHAECVSELLLKKILLSPYRCDRIRHLKCAGQGIIEVGKVLGGAHE